MLAMTVLQDIGYMSNIETSWILWVWLGYLCCLKVSLTGCDTTFPANVSFLSSDHLFPLLLYFSEIVNAYKYCIYVMGVSTSMVFYYIVILTDTHNEHALQQNDLCKVLGYNW